jgi:PHD/YefM family antitoxin component YafN of YafNO toxin-antitoxin module
LKANAAEVLQVLEEQRKPMIITQNGEAKAVIQDVTWKRSTSTSLSTILELALTTFSIGSSRRLKASKRLLTEVPM